MTSLEDSNYKGTNKKVRHRSNNNGYLIFSTHNNSQSLNDETEHVEFELAVTRKGHAARDHENNGHKSAVRVLYTEGKRYKQDGDRGKGLATPNPSASRTYITERGGIPSAFECRIRSGKDRLCCSKSNFR